MSKHQTMTIEEFLGISGKPKKYKRQPDKVPAKETALSSQANGTQVEIWLPKMSRATHPNIMGHWRTKHKAKKAQKELAWLAAKEAMGSLPPWKSATVEPVYFTHRSVDKDNIIGWLKSSFDALQGIVIENDSGLTPLPPQIVTVEFGDPKRGGILLVVTKTG